MTVHGILAGIAQISGLAREIRDGDLRSAGIQARMSSGEHGRDIRRCE